MPYLARIVSVATCFCLVYTSPASADPWQKHGQRCDSTVFEDPQKAPIADLKKCVRLFEAYRAVASLKADEKKRQMYRQCSSM